MSRAGGLAALAALLVSWPWLAPRYFVFLASLVLVNAVVAIAMLKLFHEQLWEGLSDSVGTSSGAAVLAFAGAMTVLTWLVVAIAR